MDGLRLLSTSTRKRPLRPSADLSVRAWKIAIVDVDAFPFGFAVAPARGAGVLLGVEGWSPVSLGPVPLAWTKVGVAEPVQAEQAEVPY